MQSIPLSAKPREIIGKKVKKLRAEGLLPAGVYGKDIKSESLELSVKDFMKVYDQAGETGLVELKFDHKNQPVLIKNVQFHPLTRLPLHAQFHAVKLTEKIKANVPLELIGESPAVRDGIGVLLQTLNEVEVEALPTDLPEKIEVDSIGLVAVDDQVTIGQLKVPKGVTILTSAEEIVVKVAPAVSEETKKEIAAEEAAKAAAATVAGAAPTGTPASEAKPAESASEAKTEESKKEEKK